MSDLISRQDEICAVAGVADIGELSDGYHTFNGLYEQRMILFAALVKVYKAKAWKSYRHEDGEYCFGGGWFIVGIDTPEGSYTYHYENKYWDMFDCVDLPRGKHWDGHTEADAETRIMSLEPELDSNSSKVENENGDLISRQMAIDEISKQQTYKMFYGEDNIYFDANDIMSVLADLPSAQSKPITVNIDHELTPYEYEKLRKDIANAPIILLPSAQKKGEWIDGYCSVCKCDMPIFHEDEDLKYCETDFCPNCGSSMGEEKCDE